MPVRVLIADDHPFFVQSLAEAVDAMPGFTVAGIAANGIEAIAMLRKTRPDCALIDYAMPGANGLEVLYEVRRWSPDTRVLILTGHQHAETLGAVVDAGVEGLLSKSATPAQILGALREIVDGGTVLDPGLGAAIRRRADLPALSPREIEVLRLIARGQSNAEAALSLALSPKTVDGHRTNLMRKLDVRSTATLILVAVRRGLIDPWEIE